MNIPLLKKIFLIFWVFFLSGIPPVYCAPEFRRNSVILDDETETIVADWVSKLFRAANVRSLRPKIHIIVDPEVNAAAAPGGNIIINTGFILECHDVGHFIGVLAHEVGHVASVHSDMGEAFNEGLVPAAAALLIGGLATAATGDPNALIAGALGGQHLLERTMLRFSRTQEVSADHAAMTYLDRLGWPSVGLMSFFKILEEKTPAFASQISKYALTHPLTNERIISVRAHIEKSPLKNAQFPEEMEEKFQCIKAKLSAFMEKPDQVLRRYPPHRQDAAARYAHTIMAYRQSKIEDALAQLDKLIQKTPSNPYFHELKGQILFDHGRIQESIASFKNAKTIKPQSLLFSLLLAQAYLESKTSQDWQEALRLLLAFSSKNHENPFVWRLLATAYGRLDNPGMAKLALAEEACALKKGPEAKAQLAHALKLLPKNSPGYLRAQDLARSFKNGLISSL